MLNRRPWTQLPDWYWMKYIAVSSILTAFFTKGDLAIMILVAVLLWLMAYIGKNMT